MRFHDIAIYFTACLSAGLVFIVVGALIFGQGILYSRAKGRKTEIKQ